MSHADNNVSEAGDTKAERIAGGFLVGVLKVAGYSVLAVIAGYSAGIAFNKCVSKERTTSSLGTSH